MSLLLFIGPLAAPPAGAEQSAQPQPNYLPGCPPGHRIAVQLTNIPTLYVEWTWLDSIPRIAIREKFGAKCPDGPVNFDQDGSIWFGPEVLKILDIQSGLEWFRLSIRENIPRSESIPPSPSLAPVKDGQPPALQASMTMTGLAPWDPRFAKAREYYLTYPEPDGYAAITVNITCDGPNGDRWCGLNSLPFVVGLPVQYHLRQTRLPIPDAISTDPDTEPGALLQFDTRLRAWLISLDHPPQ